MAREKAQDEWFKGPQLEPWMMKRFYKQGIQVQTTTVFG